MKNSIFLMPCSLFQNKSIKEKQFNFNVFQINNILINILLKNFFLNYFKRFDKI
jgi:hypothetical protein